MAHYRIDGIQNNDGSKRTLEIEALDEQSAVTIAKQSGIYPTKITPLRRSKNADSQDVLDDVYAREVTVHRGVVVKVEQRVSSIRTSGSAASIAIPLFDTGMSIATAVGSGDSKVDCQTRVWVRKDDGTEVWLQYPEDQFAVREGNEVLFAVLFGNLVAATNNATKQQKIFADKLAVTSWPLVKQANRGKRPLIYGLFAGWICSLFLFLPVVYLQISKIPVGGILYFLWVFGAMAGLLIYFFKVARDTAPMMTKHLESVNRVLLKVLQTSPIGIEKK